MTITRKERRDKTEEFASKERLGRIALIGFAGRGSQIPLRSAKSIITTVVANLSK
jgi:hypothetical protein